METHSVAPLLNFLTNKSDILISSDDSKTTTKSGGGWVIVTKDGTNIIRCSNPDY